MTKLSNIYKTNDESNTLFNKKFNQHYHNPSDGALNETIYKHIIPALKHHKNKKELNILDICFGLGYNTFTTIYYIKLYNLKTKVNIFTPEIDNNLICSLKNFIYPKEFNSISCIISQILQDKYYKNNNIYLDLYWRCKGLYKKYQILI